LKKENIHFASFDDINLFNFVQPTVLSVSQPIEHIGSESAKLVLKLIDKKSDDLSNTFEKIVLPTTIVLRA
jgi:DNA-binding LacI/PurR family transcriptional regulator